MRNPWDFRQEIQASDKAQVDTIKLVLFVGIALLILCLAISFD